MAAAQLKDVTLDEAKQLLIEALEKYFLENMTDTKTTTQKEN
jgi:c-di-AMP phosphodiesterase-like protein